MHNPNIYARNKQLAFESMSTNQPLKYRHVVHRLPISWSRPTHTHTHTFQSSRVSTGIHGNLFHDEKKARWEQRWQKWIEILRILEIKEGPTPAVYLCGVCIDVSPPLQVANLKHGCRFFWLLLSFNYRHVIEMLPRRLITTAGLGWDPLSQFTWA